jgi:hypothetical protein
MQFLCNRGRHSDELKGPSLVHISLLEAFLETPRTPFFLSGFDISTHRFMCGRAHRVELIYTWALHTGLELPVHTNYVKSVISVQIPWDKKLHGVLSTITLFSPIEESIPYLNDSRDVFQSHAR